ncbi:MAG TPA: class I SAM-dependent methyltransferase [Acidimicrobiia bacterium]|nr:class I SAM-dependent methyltransferase [Acidimicrobiia bacterium]
MIRARTLVILFGVAAVVGTVMRHLRGSATGHTVPGGTLINDAVMYDTISRLLLGSLFGHIADDIAEVAPDNAQVLEVGCGPGHLSIQLARRHGLDVTGLDLDPAMIERARANADSAGGDNGRRPSFLVGDVASLTFPDESFDLVVSTLSMHHWADPVTGLTEIDRVLRPGGRALVWDFRPDVWPVHAHLPDPVERTQGSPLRVVSATPWRWPWKFNLIQRIELAPTKV